MAVVAEDRPQGQILWVNDRAYGARILPGMRYAAGLALCRDLCAGEVSEEALRSGVERIVETLRSFSPFVEASSDEPGVFWLDAEGLRPLERSLQEWAQRIRATLWQQELVARVAVGFSRFGSYAMARTAADIVVVDSPAEERSGARGVRLDRLRLDPALRDRLARLGIRTVGTLLDLPVDDLGRRFGRQAQRLYRRASGDLREPIDREIPERPLEAWIELEYPEVDAARLTHGIASVLDALLERLERRDQGLSALALELCLDDREHRIERVSTAAPTLDAKQILELVRLRLETLELSAGVVEMRLEARGSSRSAEQAGLFTERPRRDPSAASRAFARLRAEFGRLAVVWARLHRAHLPEAGFSWEALERPHLPAPRRVANRPLVRRLFDRPVPLPHRGHREPDGWLVRGPEQGPMVRIHGPYTISGGWWVREVQRDYHFVETGKGDIVWVYYDRRRRRWFLQGQVE